MAFVPRMKKMTDMLTAITFGYYVLHATKIKRPHKKPHPTSPAYTTKIVGGRPKS
jgi:hypothetical protein